jgi:hypothetical protein
MSVFDLTMLCRRVLTRCARGEQIAFRQEGLGWLGVLSRSIAPS